VSKAPEPVGREAIGNRVRVRSASETDAEGRPADKQEQTIEDGNGYGGGGGEQVPCSETVQGRRLERGGRALVAMVAIRSVWVACACGGYRQVARGVRGSGDACCMGCKEGRVQEVVRVLAGLQCRSGPCRCTYIVPSKAAMVSWTRRRKASSTRPARNRRLRVPLPLLARLSLPPSPPLQIPISKSSSILIVSEEK